MLLMLGMPVMAGKEADGLLLQACERGDLEMVARSLKEGADPNARGGREQAPALHLALGRKSAEAVDLLVKAGADFFVKAEDGSSALHAAASAWGGAEETMESEVVVNLKRVLESGVPVGARNHAGTEALELAARRGPLRVRLLLEKGAQASPAALAAALWDNNLETVEVLMRAGADPMVPLPDGENMFHALAGGYPRSGKKMELLGLLELLKVKGVAVDQRDNEGRTPLMVAAQSRLGDGVRWFLENGANAKTMDHKGRTALILACDAENDYGWQLPEIFAALLKAGCPLNGVDAAGRTALDVARQKEQWWTVLLLVKAGAEVREPKVLLKEALLKWRDLPDEPVAMRFLVRALLAKAVEAPELQIGGRPLVQVMVFLADPFLLDLALRHGARVDAVDSEGRTALMWASSFLADEMTDLLLKAGADASLRDAGGKTAADWRTLAMEGAGAEAQELSQPEVKPAGGGDGFALIASGGAEEIRRLLAAQPGLTAETKFGLTALQWAAMHGRTGASALLLKAGMPPEGKGAEGRTPWELAVLVNQAGWCRWFLDRVGETGRPQLLESASALAEEQALTLPMAGVLLDAGWKPSPAAVKNIFQKYGDGPDRGEVRARLAGFLPKDSNKEKDPFAAEDSGAANGGETDQDILKNAITYQKIGVLEFCFASGTRVTPGGELLHLAVGMGNVEIAGLLMRYGANLHEVDSQGDLPAHHAARHGRRAAMALLIREGADLTRKNKEGRSPLEEAREAGLIEWADEWEREAAGNRN